MNKNLTKCPNCEVEWEPEEIAIQECWICGYPNQKDDDLEDEED